MYSTFAKWEYSKYLSSRKSTREVDGWGREVDGFLPPQGVLPQNWGRTEQNCTVACMVIKAKANVKIKPLATMNFVLDLMLLSIRWYKQQHNISKIL
ncbi:hypothetical protein TNCV_1727931 [Trichonephila clavipes]|nr:hypothetical protein TNCV_1727931 [Trichonephila clavipes]